MLHHQFRRSLFNFLKKEGLETKLDLRPDAEKNMPKRDIPEEFISHYPVMHREIEELVTKHVFSNVRIEDYDNETANKAMFDCTLGAGGHSRRLLEKFPFLYMYESHSKSWVKDVLIYRLGVDLDSRMIDHVEKKVLPEMKLYNRKRLNVEHSNYADMEQFSISKAFPGIFPHNKKFDCILADFGFSSMHVDNGEWGFSIKNEGKLDMRYDSKAATRTAADLLNHGSVLELSGILKRYGEEPSSELLAKLIAKERENKPFETTGDLKQLVYTKMNADRDSKNKILTRVFQALRIAINHEFLNIERLMQTVTDNLAYDGIAVFLTFHSLEEKLVLNHIKKQKKDKDLKILEQNCRPSNEEKEENPRSRSAKLHAIKKLRPTPSK